MRLIDDECLFRNFASWLFSDTIISNQMTPIMENTIL